MIVRYVVIFLVLLAAYILSLWYYLKKEKEKDGVNKYED